jgi:spermidine/putrescine transport system ATP-binding protein
VVRLSLAAPDGSPIVANVTHAAGLPSVQPGDEVWASWSQEACRVLPEADVPLTDEELVVES